MEMLYLKKTVIFGLALLLLSISSMAQKKHKILVFSKTTGFYHDAIPAGNLAILKLGKDHQFEVDTTTNAAYFTKDNLSKYAAVVFLNTTGDILNEEQQAAFEGYIQSGNGFAGVHSATDTEYNWPWYGKLVGAYFGSHPEQQTAILKVKNKKTIASRHLPKEWRRKDEWYNFKWVTSTKLNVLITIDESSYQPGKGAMGNYHPVSWYHRYDGGRSFYTALGHTKASYKEPLFLQHLLGGLQYAMGAQKM